MSVTVHTKIIAGFLVEINSKSLNEFISWLMDGELAFEIGGQEVVGLDISDQFEQPVNGNLCSIFTLSPKLFTEENLRKLKKECIEEIEKDVKENGEGQIQIPDEFYKLVSQDIQIFTTAHLS